MTKGFDDLTCPNDSKNLCQSQTDRKTDQDSNQSAKKTYRLENKIDDIF